MYLEDLPNISYVNMHYIEFHRNVWLFFYRNVLFLAFHIAKQTGANSQGKKPSAIR